MFVSTRFSANAFANFQGIGNFNITGVQSFIKNLVFGRNFTER